MIVVVARMVAYVTDMWRRAKATPEVSWENIWPKLH